MQLQALEEAFGAAIPTYEIAGCRGKKAILHLAVAILVGVMAILGPTGCGRTPKIYKMPPDDLERVRSGLGRIGVAVSTYPLKQEINKPAKGIFGGAARGVVVGASAAVVLGAVAPVPGGTVAGVLAAPFTAVAGGVYGATKGAPAEGVETAKAAFVQAAERLKKKNLPQTLVEEVTRLGRERTGLDFVDLPGAGPGDPGEVVRYDRMAIRNVDAVLELRLEKNGLWGPYRFDPPFVAFIETLVRLIRVEDNVVLLSETFICAAEVERKFPEWAESEGRLFVDKLTTCIPEIAEKIVDDLFRVHPTPWP